MRRKVNMLLIIMALFAAPLTVSAAGQNTITVDEIKARAAEAQTKGREVVVKVRPGTKILVGSKELPFEFIRSTSLSGRVKEIREKDFTFSDTSDGKEEATAVISYADVLSIKHTSGFAKVLKKIGKYSVIGMTLPAIIPLSVLALLGLLPKC